ncbi:MAG: T9SS type A sorting domain-containing protein [Bacteroidota bacterium]
MKNTILLLLLIFVQTLFPQKFSHPLRAGVQVPAKSVRMATASGTLKVLVIRVQFQTDNDSRTSGNGQFDLGPTTERIIDSPPHDSAYVADHFTFAQNYFTKASNGKFSIAATVLGNVITLKKTMKDYAVISGNLPLAQMVEESWKAADSLYPGYPFQNYDMFAIIHAGVGKDIDLRAALGYDPTPMDLPSLYFSLDALKGLFGPSYQGVTLANSSFKITNTVVLPETEVRRIPSVNGDFVLKLGINGLLVASIGSHLGLPDLFDTKTGKSAIGRFGLMDGQSIFSFSGICPPEPSAWEKIYLGWSVPIDVPVSASLGMPAVGKYDSGNDTIYRIPISAKEYFLVENRFRDVKGDGQSVTMKWNGQTLIKTFTKDEEYFTNANIDSAYGVITNVDELDWSLPGVVNANNNYLGGILIWHIDEGIIKNTLPTNTINANSAKRGVDLEEADGSQDIGQSYDFGSPASGSEDGWPFDYWYKGNSFPLYKNEFSEQSIPNSLSNSGAHSLVTLKNFSGQSARMTFDAVIGTSDIQSAKVIKRKNVKLNSNDAPTSFDLNNDGKKEFIYTSGDSIYVLKDDFTPFLNNATGLFSKAGGRFQPVPLKIISLSSTALAALQGNSLLIFSAADANADGLADTLYSAVNSSPFTTPPVSYTTAANGQSHILAGDAAGRRLDYYRTAPNTWLKDSIQYFSSPVAGLSLSDLYIGYSSDSVRNIATRSLLNGKTIAAFTSRSASANYLLLNDNTFGLYRFSSPTDPIEYYGVPEKITGAFAVYDVNGDGEFDYIIGAGNKLYAFSPNGVIIEHFPFTVKDGGSVVGSPVIAKKNGSDDVLIFFGTTNGHLYAVNGKGETAAGFPLQTGGIVSSPLLWNEYLSVASTDSSLYTWKIAGLIDTSKIYWKGSLVDEFHSNYQTATTSSNKKSAELLPKKFAYNWPNPVYSGTTNIRYFLGKAATVKITIVNLAGELVAELKGTNYVGVDNEVPWNISGIQSGIYFAQITAAGSGEEMSQIVKIAVVK